MGRNDCDRYQEGPDAPLGDVSLAVCHLLRIFLFSRKFVIGMGLVIVGFSGTPNVLGSIFGTRVIVTGSSSSRMNTINQPTPGVGLICLRGNNTDSRCFTRSNVGIPESVTEVFLSK